MIPWLALALAGHPDVPDHHLRWHNGLQVEKQQAVALGAWAGANMVGSGVGWAVADDQPLQTFFPVHLGFNTMNLALAAGNGLAVAQRGKDGPPSLEAIERQQRGIQRLLVARLVLDGVYAAGGGVAWGVGGELGPVDVRGVGQALVAQGVTLALFDTVFLLRHRARTH